MQGSTSRHVSRPQASSSPRHKGYVTQTSEPQAHSQGARVAQKVEREPEAEEAKEQPTDVQEGGREEDGLPHARPR